MKFFIDKTSVYNHIQPHSLAVKEDGKWVIEISDLETLMAFIKTEDAVVITSHLNGYKYRRTNPIEEILDLADCATLLCECLKKV